MNEQLENLKLLLHSENAEDKMLALNMLQTSYFKFEEIKDIIYEYIRGFDKLSEATEEDVQLKNFILETIIANSERIIKERRGKIDFWVSKMNKTLYINIHT